MRKLDAPLMGVREWRVDQRGELFSTNIGGSWKGEMKAMCLRPDYDPFAPYGWATDPGRRYIENLEHSAPHKGCHCGLYAFYNLDLCKEHGDNISGLSSGIRGVVSAWGKVIRSEYGFKAEYMRLEALIAERELFEYWGAELSLVPAYEALADKHGCALIKPEEVSAFMALSGGVVMESDPQPEEELDDPHLLTARMMTWQLSTPYARTTLGKAEVKSAQSRAEAARESVERLESKDQSGLAMFTLLGVVLALALIGAIIMVVTP